MSDIVSRKIQFFRVKLLNVVENTLVPIDNQSEVFGQIIDHIDTLPFTKEGNSRYLTIEDGNSLALHKDSNVATIDGKIAFKRTNLLPDLETSGVLKPLILPTETGLAEVTHFVYFPQSNIIGIELNFFGPRAPRLAEYLYRKSNELVHRVEFEPILNMDVSDQLNRIGEVSLMSIQIQRNAIEIFNEINESLGAAFRGAAMASEAESVEIILRKKKFAREGFRFPFDIPDLLRVFGSVRRQDINKFQVVAKDNDTEEGRKFDLLQDKLITSKKVVRTSSRRRTINSDSMYSAIKLAYDELSDQLVP